MKILVLNSGSSSIKYQLIDAENEKLLAKGLVEKIGITGSSLTHKVNGKSFVFNETLNNHAEGLKLVLETLKDDKVGVIKTLKEIDAIGHRVVHGGEIFKKPTLVSEKEIANLKGLVPLAPLHMPANIMGIEACKEVLPKVPNVAMFDTAFHSTMPDFAFMYATPYDWYEKYGVRKYGFHGISHEYITKKVAEIEFNEKLKIINCHIGNGASICAIKNGKCVDTTMGLTPLEGLMMGTRCGDIDASIVPYMMKKLNLSENDIVDSYLNKKSGLLGVSGVTNDYRDVYAAAEEGNKKAQLALEMFYYRIKKYIGAYAAALGGVDVIVFTAGSGENRIEMREKVMEGLEFIGTVDKNKNDNFIRGEIQLISTDDSKAKIYVIPTDEEIMIARETAMLVAKQ